MPTAGSSHRYAGVHGTRRSHVSLGSPSLPPMPLIRLAVANGRAAPAIRRDSEFVSSNGNPLDPSAMMRAAEGYIDAYFVKTRSLEGAMTRDVFWERASAPLQFREGSERGGVLRAESPQLTSVPAFFRGEGEAEEGWGVSATNLPIVYIVAFLAGDFACDVFVARWAVDRLLSDSASKWHGMLCETSMGPAAFEWLTDIDLYAERGSAAAREILQLFVRSNLSVPAEGAIEDWASEVGVPLWGPEGACDGGAGGGIPFWSYRDQSNTRLVGLNWSTDSSLTCHLRSLVCAGALLSASALDTYLVALGCMPSPTLKSVLLQRAGFKMRENHFGVCSRTGKKYRACLFAKHSGAFVLGEAMIAELRATIRQHGLLPLYLPPLLASSLPCISKWGEGAVAPNAVRTPRKLYEGVAYGHAATAPQRSSGKGGGGCVAKSRMEVHTSSCSNASGGLAEADTVTSSDEDVEAEESDAASSVFSADSDVDVSPAALHSSEIGACLLCAVDRECRILATAGGGGGCAPRALCGSAAIAYARVPHRDKEDFHSKGAHILSSVVLRGVAALQSSQLDAAGQQGATTSTSRMYASGYKWGLSWGPTLLHRLAAASPITELRWSMAAESAALSFRHSGVLAEPQSPCTDTAITTTALIVESQTFAFTCTPPKTIRLFCPHTIFTLSGSSVLRAPFPALVLVLRFGIADYFMGARSQSPDALGALCGLQLLVGAAVAGDGAGRARRRSPSALEAALSAIACSSHGAKCAAHVASVVAIERLAAFDYPLLRTGDLGCAAVRQMVFPSTIQFFGDAYQSGPSAVGAVIRLAHSLATVPRLALPSADGATSAIPPTTAQPSTSSLLPTLCAQLCASDCAALPAGMRFPSPFPSSLSASSRGGAGGGTEWAVAVANVVSRRFQTFLLGAFRSLIAAAVAGHFEARLEPSDLTVTCPFVGDDAQLRMPTWPFVGANAALADADGRSSDLLRSEVAPFVAIVRATGGHTLGASGRVLLSFFSHHPQSSNCPACGCDRNAANAAMRCLVCAAVAAVWPEGDASALKDSAGDLSRFGVNSHSLFDAAARCGRLLLTGPAYELLFLGSSNAANAHTETTAPGRHRAGGSANSGGGGEEAARASVAAFAGGITALLWDMSAQIETALCGIFTADTPAAGAGDTATAKGTVTGFTPPPPPPAAALLRIVASWRCIWRAGASVVRLDALTAVEADWLSRLAWQEGAGEERMEEGSCTCIASADAELNKTAPDSYNNCEVNRLLLLPRLVAAVFDRCDAVAVAADRSSSLRYRRCAATIADAMAAALRVVYGHPASTVVPNTSLGSLPAKADGESLVFDAVALSKMIDVGSRRSARRGGLCSYQQETLRRALAVAQMIVRGASLAQSRRAQAQIPPRPLSLSAGGAPIAPAQCRPNICEEEEVAFSLYASSSHLSRAVIARIIAEGLSPSLTIPCEPLCAPEGKGGWRFEETPHGLPSSPAAGDDGDEDDGDAESITLARRLDCLEPSYQRYRIDHPNPSALALALAGSRGVEGEGATIDANDSTLYFASSCVGEEVLAMLRCYCCSADRWLRVLSEAVISSATTAMRERKRLRTEGSGGGKAQQCGGGSARVGSLCAHARAVLLTHQEHRQILGALRSDEVTRVIARSRRHSSGAATTAVDTVRQAPPPAADAAPRRLSGLYSLSLLHIAFDSARLAQRQLKEISALLLELSAAL